MKTPRYLGARSSHTHTHTMRERKRLVFRRDLKDNEDLSSWYPSIHDVCSRGRHDDARFYLGTIIRWKRFALLTMFLDTLGCEGAREVFLRREDESGTLLHKLIRSRALKATQRVLDTLGDVYPGDYPDCWDVVDEAIAVQSPDTVRALYRVSPMFCEACDQDGRIALHRTVAADYYDMTMRLFDLFPPWAARQDGRGRTPLMDAAQLGRFDAVRYMLEYEGGLFYERYLLAFRSSDAMAKVLGQFDPEEQRRRREREQQTAHDWLRDHMSPQAHRLIPLDQAVATMREMQRDTEHRAFMRTVSTSSVNLTSVDDTSTPTTPRYDESGVPVLDLHTLSAHPPPQPPPRTPRTPRAAAVPPEPPEPDPLSSAPLPLPSAERATSGPVRRALSFSGRALRPTRSMKMLRGRTGSLTLFPSRSGQSRRGTLDLGDITVTRVKTVSGLPSTPEVPNGERTTGELNGEFAAMGVVQVESDGEGGWADTVVEEEEA